MSASDVSPERRAARLERADAERAAGRGFRPDVEGMRAIAIVLVVAYHADLLWVSAGYVGVDVFFVISGFLITRQLFESQHHLGRVHLIDFYVRRMKRLLPAAAIVTLAVLAAARVWSGPLAAKDIADDAFFSAIYGMNLHLANEGNDYLSADEAASPLMHFWSLSIEEQFYLGLPLLVLALVLVGAQRRRVVLLGALSVITAWSLWWSITLTPDDGVTAYYALSTRAWEFGLGGLVALLGPKLVLVPRQIAAVASWVGLAMIIYAAFTFDGATAFPGYAALLPVGGSALLIAAGARRVSTGAEWVLGTAPALTIGRLSYSLYLWHWPVLVFLPLAVNRELATPLRVVAVVLSLLLAMLTYALVEAPLRRVKLRRPVWLLPGLGLSAATAATALVFAATLPALTGGGTAAEATPLSPVGPVTAAGSSAAALAAGTLIRAVPSNLSPSLRNAENDHDYGNGCHLDFPTVTQPACTFGDPAAPAARTMVLFGDSHAAQWFAPLNDLATARSWKLLLRTKSACSPAQVSVKLPKLRRVYTECADWRAARVAEIVALAPALVVVGQSDVQPGVTATDEAWAAATVKSLIALRASGALVVLLGDNPQAPHDPVECVAKHLKDARACAYPRAGAYKSFPQRQAVLGSALRASAFDLLPTTDWVCGATLCPPVVGNLLTYRDDDHVSKSYARWLRPMLEPIVLYAEARTPRPPAPPVPAPPAPPAPAPPAPAPPAPPPAAPAPAPPAAPADPALPQSPKR